MAGALDCLGFLAHYTGQQISNVAILARGGLQTQRKKQAADRVATLEIGIVMLANGHMLLTFWGLPAEVDMLSTCVCLL
jgi:hypothetical protein